MGNSFWSDFFANFFSDLIVGAILGTLLAWWVGRRLGESERSQQRKDEREAELNKAVRYLELLGKEIDDLLDMLPRVTEAFKSTGWGLEFWLPTPRWDILQPSGELPRLLDPGLVELLAKFYDGIKCANRGKQLLVESWLVPNPDMVPGMRQKQASFQEMTLLGLESALQLGKAGLSAQLGSGIKSLRNQVANL